jgi:hypothetical protein
MTLPNLNWLLNDWDNPLAICIDKAYRSMEEAGIHGEVIVADNGSTDGSQEIAIAHGARLVAVPRRGYGAALSGGFSNAKGRFLLMADADDSYNFLHISRFVEALRQGADLVMGNRFQGGIEPGAMPFLHRYLGNPVLSFIGRTVFKARCGDFHCGMRALTREAAERLQLRTTGMEFASEMVVKATVLHMKVAEVPTTLSPDGRSRPPHLRTWRDGWRHLRFLLLYSPRWLFLYPGIAFMLLGMLVAGWVLPGRQTIGSVSFDVNTLVYALGAILIGFQTVIFSLFARIYAQTVGLLPDSRRIRRWLSYVSLERGIVLGVLLTIAAIVGVLYGLDLWHNAGFGELHPYVLRLTLCSSEAMLLSVEMIFASFFLSVLRLVDSRSFVLTKDSNNTNDQ